MVTSNRKILKTIIISGIDGSGKTSVINALQIELKKKGYYTAYIWLRFNHYLVKILHGLARILGLSVKVKNEMGTVWQHRFYKSSLFCYIYVISTYFDTIISKFKLNNFVNSDIDFVICDRWINDILIDLGTKTHRIDFLQSAWFKRFQKLVPDNTIQCLIIRDDEKLLDCRLENRVDPDFSLRNKLYKDLSQSNYVQVIDNNGTIEESVKQILKSINL
jgi:thymidylate kinase